MKTFPSSAQSVFCSVSISELSRCEVQKDRTIEKADTWLRTRMPLHQAGYSVTPPLSPLSTSPSLISKRFRSLWCYPFLARLLKSQRDLNLWISRREIFSLLRDPRVHSSRSTQLLPCTFTETLLNLRSMRCISFSIKLV